MMIGISSKSVPWTRPINPVCLSISLKTSRLPRNIGEIKFSQNGMTLVALEFDGSVVVWQQGRDGTFDGVGQLLRVGSPIYGLEVADSGMSFSVKQHLGGTKNWVYAPDAGEFVAT